MNNKLYIGLSGVARSGKNLFCDISKKILKEKYFLKSSSYALADILKKDCESFVKEKLGMDVFSDSNAEKKVFREFLVWYGEVKRQATDGRHWIENLHANMKNDDSDVIFVTDVRYAFYEKDEIYWIKNELNGKLIHISKYTYGFPTDETSRRIRSDVANTKNKIYTEPANEKEMWNDPKVKRAADILFEWEHITVDGREYKDIVSNEHLNEQVYEVYKKIFK
jgi:hypothetical protein